MYHLICFILFIICNLINLVTYFPFGSRSDQDYEYAIQNLNELMKNFTYCYREPFFQDWPGRAILISIVVFRDGFTLLAQIFLSLYSILLLDKYLKDQVSRLSDINPSNSSQIVNQLEEYNDNLTKMTLYLSLCSILSNVGIGFGYITWSYNDPGSLSLIRLLIFVANLFGILKYISNFFLFYHFNKSFRSTFQCFKYENSYSN